MSTIQETKDMEFGFNPQNFFPWVAAFCSQDQAIAVFPKKLVVAGSKNIIPRCELLKQCSAIISWRSIPISIRVASAIPLHEIKGWWPAVYNSYIRLLSDHDQKYPDRQINLCQIQRSLTPRWVSCWMCWIKQESGHVVDWQHNQYRSTRAEYLKQVCVRKTYHSR